MQRVLEDGGLSGHPTPHITKLPSKRLIRNQCPDKVLLILWQVEVGLCWESLGMRYLFGLLIHQFTKHLLGQVRSWLQGLLVLRRLLWRGRRRGMTGGITHNSVLLTREFFQKPSVPGGTLKPTTCHPMQVTPNGSGRRPGTPLNQRIQLRILSRCRHPFHLETNSCWNGKKLKPHLKKQGI